MLVRIGGALLWCLVGAPTGVASVALHEKSAPWLVLALAAPTAAAWALPAGWWRAGFALGWIGAVMLAVQGRPEGDFAILSTVNGYLLLAGALGLVVLSVVTLPVRRADSGSGAVAT